MDKVTDEKLEKYFKLTEDALEMARDNVNPDRDKEAATILDMASRYLSDAKHFLEQGDKVTSFAALNYAHGWLDCGAMLNILDVDDDRLFTVDVKTPKK